MNIGNHFVMVDTATRFHKTMYISGWFRSKSDSLVDVRVSDEFFVIAQSAEISRRGESSSIKRESITDFSLQLFTQTPYDLDPALQITFLLESGNLESVALTELIADRTAQFRSPAIYDEFCQSVISTPGAKVLDIGGRDRSKLDRSKAFPGVDYTVLDIVPSANVDVVGDAHKISKYFEAEQFDFVLSLSVFEHLAMPWRVALEMNKVMKMGAIGYIQAPQSCGLHDMPWDFWRFSDSAWDAIFNKASGFKIIDRAYDFENFVLPFLLRDVMLDAEKAAGFENTVVLVQKISETELVWSVDPADVIKGEYPREGEGRKESWPSLIWKLTRKLLKF